MDLVESEDEHVQKIEHFTKPQRKKAGGKVNSNDRVFFNIILYTTENVLYINSI